MANKRNKRMYNDTLRAKKAIISAIGDCGEMNITSKAVLAALIDCMIDAAIIVAGRERAAEVICQAVNIRLLSSPCHKIKP